MNLLLLNNLPYFRQNRKMRDSSNESDDELEQFDQPPASPPPRSIIDGTKNVLPSQIKAAAVSANAIKTKV